MPLLLAGRAQPWAPRKAPEAGQPLGLMGSPTPVLLPLKGTAPFMRGRNWRWSWGVLDSTGDIYQSHELNEYCNLLIKNLILVLRSENIRECQTLVAEKLTEMRGQGSGESQAVLAGGGAVRRLGLGRRGGPLLGEGAEWGWAPPVDPRCGREKELGLQSEADLG